MPVIKGALLWLKGRVGTWAGVPICETEIQGHLESDFQDLLALLKKNKRKLGADPARRAFLEDLGREFRESMGKLGAAP